MTQTKWSTWAVPAEICTNLPVRDVYVHVHFTQIHIWIEFYHTGLVDKFVVV
jgi:hypothetical protein